MTPASGQTSPVRRDGRMQIGRVAELCDLSLRTVRYYEEQALIEPDARSEGGFRLYTDEQVQRLLLIKQMKPLGFTIAEMRELLDARDRVRTAADGPDREAAAASLAGYAEAAADRCVRLREQLALAEEFAATLRAPAA